MAIAVSDFLLKVVRAAAETNNSDHSSKFQIMVGKKSTK